MKGSILGYTELIDNEQRCKKPNFEMIRAYMLNRGELEDRHDALWAQYVKVAECDAKELCDKDNNND